jgi:DNA repair protein RecO (recombination protein O)
MPLYNTEAINIRTRNTGEADKIITLFTRNSGKIQAIAKGARRPSSKFGGRLEIFAYNQMLLASARTFDIISQCESIESFYTLREDRDKINAGVYFIKLIDMATEDRQRNEGLFDLLLCSLRLLAGQADPVVLSRAFEVKFCDTEGLLPSNEMLEKRYKKLPALVSALGRVFEVGKAEISEKDLEISGKIFKELISDQIGKDIRRYKSVI